LPFSVLHACTPSHFLGESLLELPNLLRFAIRLLSILADGSIVATLLKQAEPYNNHLIQHDTLRFLVYENGTVQCFSRRPVAGSPVVYLGVVKILSELHIYSTL
jgi:hypothetical protein